jgi:intraflagellar transport protein 46
MLFLWCCLLQAPLKKTLDKPFDEVHEVSGTDDDASHASPSASPTAKSAPKGGAPGGPAAPKPAAKPAPAAESSEEEDDDEASAEAPKAKAPAPAPAPAPAAAPKKEAIKAGGSSSEEESESEDEASTAQPAAGGEANADGTAARGGKAYNPADYANLKVSQEIQDLFAYILRHKPTDIELETKMKPFIPDYIPAVGEIDAFLKVPRPDKETPADGNVTSDGKGAVGKKDSGALGLVVLDEPAAAQSDPTVLELSLRAVNKQVISRSATVGTIEQASKNQARVIKWIQSIEEVHRKKPPPHVHYARTMPDIEQLMQVWPPAFEELLKIQQGTASTPGTAALPDVGSIEADVASFARMVCAIMDIPVYDKLTESLHVLFTLYSEFQNHAYFQH